MTKKEIRDKIKRTEDIWDEMSPQIAGTGIASLIEELIDLEIRLEAECGQ